MILWHKNKHATLSAESTHIMQEGVEGLYTPQEPSTDGSELSAKQSTGRKEMKH